MSVKSLSEMDSVSLSNLATTMAAQNPCEGRHVTVTSGKHKGRSGRVLKQIKDEDFQVFDFVDVYYRFV